MHGALLMVIGLLVLLLIAVVVPKILAPFFSGESLTIASFLGGVISMFVAVKIEQYVKYRIEKKEFDEKVWHEVPAELLDPPSLKPGESLYVPEPIDPLEPWPDRCEGIEGDTFDASDGTTYELDREGFWFPLDDDEEGGH